MKNYKLKGNSLYLVGLFGTTKKVLDLENVGNQIFAINQYFYDSFMSDYKISKIGRKYKLYMNSFLSVDVTNKFLNVIEFDNERDIKKAIKDYLETENQIEYAV